MNNVNNNILVYALRYSMDRYTSSLSDSIEAIIFNISSFKDWEISNMITDIYFQLNINPNGVNNEELLSFVKYLKGRLNNE